MGACRSARSEIRTSSAAGSRRHLCHPQGADSGLMHCALAALRLCVLMAPVSTQRRKDAEKIWRAGGGLPSRRVGVTSPFASTIRQEKHEYLTEGENNVVKGSAANGDEPPVSCLCAGGHSCQRRASDSRSRLCGDQGRIEFHLEVSDKNQPPQQDSEVRCRHQRL